MKTKKQEHADLWGRLCAACAQQEKLVKGLTTHEKRLAVLEANQEANLDAGDTAVTDAELGRARREVKRMERDVVDGQRAFCDLAEQETVARFVLADEGWRTAQSELRELEEQSSSLEARQVAAQKRLKGRESEGAELAMVGKNLVAGELSNYLDKQTSTVTGKADKVRSDLGSIGKEQLALNQRLADCRAKVAEHGKVRQEILAAGESKLMELEGSLDQIEVRIKDARVTIDRRTVRDLLATLAKGVDEFVPGANFPTERIPNHCSVKDVRIYFWNDSGEIAEQLIHEASGPHGLWGGSWDRTLFDNRYRRTRLEAIRQARQESVEKAS